MRLFLAAELPGLLRQDVNDLQVRLAERLRGWRWVRPEAIHLTLRFLGEVSVESELRSRVDWERVAAGSAPFRIRLTEVGRFPKRGRPRVLWVGLRETQPGGVLEELASRLEGAAREAGHAPERRAFRPHLTLARSRRGAQPDEPCTDTVRDDGEGWVRQVTLFRSDLEPGGARYTALAKFPLGPGAKGAVAPQAGREGP